ncbi:MAG TPA: flagellar M-ring protein FliF [Persephonella sp.]|uniref:Flagellar M-ring protein n=1 Tax=Persephonella marina (strain DSM 14350 / EX-H1) TaxID=123214 RepID=C0QPA9_PERMH|nr:MULTISPECIES: flagellar basal-body MS-ring/collar protein FliF [Persephonella]ACO03542.1 flagellar M-ring protein FliF [Persephonella marina EX-H1]HCB69880.1 flagellar M-ring protein FliF [Persephonella sp.]
MDFNEILKKTSEFIKKNLNPRNIALIIAGLLLITFLGIIAFKTVTKEEYGVLYTHLNPDDAGSILSVLQEENIPYKVEGDGSIILVPRNKVHEIRLKLAAKGLPSGKTVGFEIFEEPKMGITQFQENVNYLRALEGELSRTIRQLDPVRDAKVNIALPKESIFVREEDEPKASIILKLWPGKDLTKEQVKAVVFLVSHAVPKLKPENVTVVDNRGRVLSDILEEDTVTAVSDKNVEIKRKLERQIEKNVQTMLSRALGEGKVVVRATVEIETGKLQQQDEIYDPDRTAVVSERKIQEKEKEFKQQEALPPGTPTNVPPVIDETGQGSIIKQKERKDTTKNYNVTKSLVNTQKPIFNIKKISVGVLIDGKYEKVKDEEGNEKYRFIPRSEEELKVYESLVKSAIGYDPKRGDQVTVVSVPFEAKPEVAVAEERKIEDIILLVAIGILGLAVLAVAAIILVKVLKGKKKVPEAVPPGISPEAAAAYAIHEKEMEEFQLEREPIYRKLVDLAQENPELIAELITKWMKEEGR